MFEKEHRDESKELRQNVVNILRRKGIDNQGARDRLLEWIKREEEKIPDNEEAQIQFIIEQAEVYKEAGLIPEAVEEFYEALEFANQARKKELYKKIILKLDELGEKAIDIYNE